MIHVGLFHHVEELARISRQALDIAALAFRIDRIEGKGRLARPGKAGDDHKLISRNIDIDILQIVLPRPADFDVFQFGHFAPSHHQERDSGPPANLNGDKRNITGTLMPRHADLAILLWISQTSSAPNTEIAMPATVSPANP